jgi:polar amino acid transport system substrate-binding protein
MLISYLSRLIAKNRKRRVPRPPVVVAAILAAWGMFFGPVSPGAELPLPLAASTWVIASESNYYPYNYWEKGRRTGLDAEIVEAILLDLGVTPVERTMTWPEVVKTVEAGACDMGYQFALNYGDPMDALPYILVGPFRDGEPVLMVRADSTIEVKSLADLEKYRVGIVEGYKSVKGFDQLARIEKLLSATTTVNLRRLLLGRVDVIIGDRAALQATADRDGKLDQVRILAMALPKMPRYFAFPKNRRDKAERFRVSFEKLRDNGTIEEIVKRWLNPSL